MYFSSTMAIKKFSELGDAFKRKNWLVIKQKEMGILSWDFGMSAKDHSLANESHPTTIGCGYVVGVFLLLHMMHSTSWVVWGYGTSMNVFFADSLIKSLVVHILSLLPSHNVGLISSHQRYHFSFQKQKSCLVYFVFKILLKSQSLRNMDGAVIGLGGEMAPPNLFIFFKYYYIDRY